VFKLRRKKGREVTGSKGKDDQDDKSLTFQEQRRECCRGDFGMRAWRGGKQATQGSVMWGEEARIEDPHPRREIRGHA